MDREDRGIAGFFLAGFLFICMVIAGGMWGCPKYSVYEQQLVGEAELARAQQNRMIAVQEAEAKKEAATLLADAEVARAKGIAQAQAIINDTLTERYIQWLMAENLTAKGPSVIYVPTEAQLPILEAGRSNAPAPIVQVNGR